MNLFMKIFGSYEGKAALDSAKADVRELDQATDKAAKNGVANLKSGLGDMLKLAGGFALGEAALRAPGFLMDAAKGAAADEQATARLNQALANLQKATGGSADDLARWKNEVDGAIATGQKLAFTDDDVRDSFQSLLAATGDTEEALKRQKAAMDLARGANIPLATATKMLGKLNEENIEVFKKLGITIGEGATEADALAAVQAKFGGQAEAYAKSSAGQFEQTKIQMAELQEGIGSALLPIMGALGVLLATVIVPAITNGLVPGIEAVSTVIGFLVEHAGALAPVFIGVAGAIATVLLPMLIAMVPVIWAQVAAWAAAAVAIIAANAPLLLIAVAIAAVIAAVVLLVQHWDTVTARFPILGQAADAVKQTLQAWASWLTGDFVTKVAGAGKDVQDAFDKVRAFVQPLIQALSAFIDAQITIVIGAMKILGQLLTGDFSGAWNTLKQTVSAVWGDIKTMVSSSIDFIKNLAPLMLDAGKAVGGAMIDGMMEGLKKTGGFAVGVAQEILGALKSMVNAAVIDPINRALEFHVGGSILGKDWGIDINPPDIPHLARGGITNGPMLAVIGDNPGGREAVIPLPPGATGIGGNTFIIYAMDGDSVRRVIPEIARQLKIHQRQTGFSFGT